MQGFDTHCRVRMHAQVLGRNLEALITKAEDLKRAWKDDFTSVEHLLLAFPDDARFGRDLLRAEGLDAKKLEAAVKDIRGSNRVTDQVQSACARCGRVDDRCGTL